MKDDLRKLLKSKSLPIKLVGVTLLELCAVSLVLLGVLSACYYLFGADTSSNMIDFVVLVWLFLAGRKHAVTSSRLNENDERDQDFRDECDRRLEKLEK